MSALRFCFYLLFDESSAAEPSEFTTFKEALIALLGVDQVGEGAVVIMEKTGLSWYFGLSSSRMV